MNKEHFLIELKLYLNQLSKEERQAILDAYIQIFDEKAALGLSEYEITQALPSPKNIAQNILEKLGLTFDTQSDYEDDWIEITHDTTYQDEANNKYIPHNSRMNRLFEMLGITLLNSFFMIWVILLIAIILMSGWLVIGIFLASPLFSLFILGTAVSTYAWFQFFVSLILLGIGLIGFIIIRPITKGAFKLFMIYHRWCWSVLKGGSTK